MLWLLEPDPSGVFEELHEAGHLVKTVGLQLHQLNQLAKLKPSVVGREIPLKPRDELRVFKEEPEVLDCLAVLHQCLSRHEIESQLQMLPQPEYQLVCQHVQLIVLLNQGQKVCILGAAHLQSHVIKCFVDLFPKFFWLRQLLNNRFKSIEQVDEVICLEQVRLFVNPNKDLNNSFK